MAKTQKVALNISIIILLVLALGLTYYLAFTPIGRCHWITYAGFQKIEERLYVSPRMPAVLHKQIIQMRQLASQRVRTFWGEQMSAPTIIFCAQDKEFARYSNRPNVPAMVHLSNFGAYVVLKPDGGNIDVMSHEIGHAELLARLGWRVKTREIPAWFDEGLALMLDYRYPQASPDSHYQRWRERVWQNFAPSSKFIPLDSLQHIQDFFGKSRFHTYRAYLSAGREVGRWLDKVGKEGLDELISSLKDGQDFAYVYEQIETKYTLD